jgi:hypothetical protein
VTGAIPAGVIPSDAAGSVRVDSQAAAIDALRRSGRQEALFIIRVVDTAEEPGGFGDALNVSKDAPAPAATTPPVGQPATK